MIQTELIGEQEKCTICHGIGLLDWYSIEIYVSLN